MIEIMMINDRFIRLRICLYENEKTICLHVCKHQEYIHTHMIIICVNYFNKSINIFLYVKSVSLSIDIINVLIACQVSVLSGLMVHLVHCSIRSFLSLLLVLALAECLVFDVALLYCVIIQISVGPV